MKRRDIFLERATTVGPLDAWARITLDLAKPFDDPANDSMLWRAALWAMGGIGASRTEAEQQMRERVKEMIACAAVQIVQEDRPLLYVELPCGRYHMLMRPVSEEGARS